MTDYRPHIKQLRAATGLSRTKFAAIISVDPMTIYSWERHQITPAQESLALLEALAQQHNTEWPKQEDTAA